MLRLGMQVPHLVEDQSVITVNPLYQQSLCIHNYTLVDSTNLRSSSTIVFTGEKKISGQVQTCVVQGQLYLPYGCRWEGRL